MSFHRSLAFALTFVLAALVPAGQAGDFGDVDGRGERLRVLQLLEQSSERLLELFAQEVDERQLRTVRSARWELWLALRDLEQTADRLWIATADDWYFRAQVTGQPRKLEQLVVMIEKALPRARPSLEVRREWDRTRRFIERAVELLADEREQEERLLRPLEHDEWADEHVVMVGLSAHQERRLEDALEELDPALAQLRSRLPGAPVGMPVVQETLTPEPTPAPEPASPGEPEEPVAELPAEPFAPEDEQPDAPDAPAADEPPPAEPAVELPPLEPGTELDAPAGPRDVPVDELDKWVLRPRPDDDLPAQELLLRDALADVEALVEDLRLDLREDADPDLVRRRVIALVRLGEDLRDLVALSDDDELESAWEDTQDALDEVAEVFGYRLIDRFGERGEVDPDFGVQERVDPDFGVEGRVDPGFGDQGPVPTDIER